MEKSRGVLDDIDLNKGQGKGVKIFIVAVIIAFALFYFFIIKPSDKENPAVQQNTEQTAPAPASQ